MNLLTKIAVLFTMLVISLLLNVNANAMPYSTDAELYDRIDQETVIQLTDDDNSGAPAQSVLDNKRADASELIDTHLRGRYTVPVDPAPKILANIEADLLVHGLYTRRPNYEIPESVTQSKKDALRLLMDINTGKLLLEDQPDIAESALVTNKKPTDRLFGDDTLSRF
jgi:phage gp36-like protein